MVGVCGGLANLDDHTKHVRYGDVIISKADHTSQAIYYFVSSIQRSSTAGTRCSFQTKSWVSSDSILTDVVDKLKKKPKRLLKKLDVYLKEGVKELEECVEMSFHRPLPATNEEESDTMMAKSGSANELRINLPLIHYGTVASGKIINKDAAVRDEFCSVNDTKAIDTGFQAVLDSVEGNCKHSFIIIRGVADYIDGTKNKEWQPYAALTAAAAMKIIILELIASNDDDDDDI